MSTHGNHCTLCTVVNYYINRSDKIKSRDLFSFFPKTIMYYCLQYKCSGMVEVHYYCYYYLLAASIGMLHATHLLHKCVVRNSVYAGRQNVQLFSFTYICMLYVYVFVYSKPAGEKLYAFVSGHGHGRVQRDWMNA